ncbi:hypothetical protein DFH09DRAFT_1331771 [Mycena vulgaris]|nr:hypothetical protein DFH09DRAFT_1331771 [Mycena vulgaris]
MLCPNAGDFFRITVFGILSAPASLTANAHAPFLRATTAAFWRPRSLLHHQRTLAHGPHSASLRLCRRAPASLTANALVMRCTPLQVLDRMGGVLIGRALHMREADAEGALRANTVERTPYLLVDDACTKRVRRTRRTSTPPSCFLRATHARAQSCAWIGGKGCGSDADVPCGWAEGTPYVSVDDASTNAYAAPRTFSSCSVARVATTCTHDPALTPASLAANAPCCALHAAARCAGWAGSGCGGGCGRVACFAVVGEDECGKMGGAGGGGDEGRGEGRGWKSSTTTSRRLCVRRTSARLAPCTSSVSAFLIATPPSYVSRVPPPHRTAARSSYTADARQSRRCAAYWISAVTCGDDATTPPRLYTSTCRMHIRIRARTPVQGEGGEERGETCRSRRRRRWWAGRPRVCPPRDGVRRFAAPADGPYTEQKMDVDIMIILGIASLRHPRVHPEANDGLGARSPIHSAGGVAFLPEGEHVFGVEEARYERALSVHRPERRRGGLRAWDTEGDAEVDVVGDGEAVEPQARSRRQDPRHETARGSGSWNAVLSGNTERDVPPTRAADEAMDVDVKVK